mmetsp:Transcript_1377/g.2897  ORF Transcript_1377/g.2897 Transcript_1377/m.2897 type:complete len:238 (+) Transcript_1377:1238-1951(+)
MPWRRLAWTARRVTESPWWTSTSCWSGRRRHQPASAQSYRLQPTPRVTATRPPLPRWRPPCRWRPQRRRRRQTRRRRWRPQRHRLHQRPQRRRRDQGQMRCQGHCPRTGALARWAAQWAARQPRAPLPSRSAMAPDGRLRRRRRERLSRPLSSSIRTRTTRFVAGLASPTSSAPRTELQGAKRRPRRQVSRRRSSRPHSTTASFGGAPCRCRPSCAGSQTPKARWPPSPARPSIGRY